MADSARKFDEAPAPQEAPKPKGGWSPEGLSLAESEQKGFEAGHEALTGKKSELDKQVEEAASGFKESTTSWWQKTKNVFSKAKSWIRNEEEIRKLDEHLASLKAGYQKKAEAAVAPEPLPSNVIDLQAHRAARAPAGPDAKPSVEPPAAELPDAAAGSLETWKLRQKAAELSAEYDRLAEEVAKEGASESSAQKKALKAGLDIAPTSAAGERLNAVYKELNLVRAELAKPKPAAEQAPTTVEPQAAEEGTDENPILLTPGMRLPSTEGVVSGETETKEAPAEPAREPSVITAPEAPMRVITSEQSPTAHGTIGGEPETPAISVEPGDIIETIPAPIPSPRDVYPNLPEPAPDSRPPGVPESLPAETPVEEPEPAPEKKESAFDKLEAKLDDAAAEIMKMPEAAESPKTFPTKIAKLPADKFLEAFKAVGAVSEGEAKDLAEQFKLDSEGFDALRKKLSLAVRKKLKG